MTARTSILFCAALLVGAALLFPQAADAGSCCGGGASTALILPKYAQGMIDILSEAEKYDGFWNQGGKYTPDPAGSDLRQYRVNIGYARRLASRWQASVVVPYVWNDNRYANLTSRTEGPGDMTLSLWYEAIDDLSSWKIREAKDMIPQVMVGASLLIPTGISPYDEVNSSFDVTGRGFYRLDGNLFIAKTVNPWNATLTTSYGTHIERAVNEEYGKFVEPYHKKLGDRFSASFFLSYNFYIGSGGDYVTASGGVTYLREADATVDGNRYPNSGFRKETAGFMLAYGSTDNDWSIRASWTHAVRQDGWGENFPVTDVYGLGVRYVFR
jgi:hypothetical protein